ncbi:integral membrane protein [Nannizzia gypsea CBS 118893]|uniref:Integral membrane protein n=1 Tax=Arthroderma gypseum (strain ATCC MYA-4604 / CBS 118893) TaxID=535722 RepID=E4URN4_ARTGP|nr:integral membrane protein [Nannizzia gypsea CBS 118893]EFR00244.1 integral membrane protein [Nannizzia gypsea CBS 118893]
MGASVGSIRFISQLLKLTAVKTLLGAAFLWLVVFQYCRYQFWRNPHSAFFNDRTGVYDLGYSLIREREAHHFITRNNAPTEPPASIKGGTDPLFCVAFVTVRREADDYFDPSIGSLLVGLDPRERRALHLNILFADTDPKRHPSWGQKWVDRLTDVAETYNVSASQLDHLKKLETERNFYEKGVFDYVYALNSCKKSNAPYTVVFEDDIIIAEGWMAKTLKGLADIKRMPSGERPWIYLRLFYTETALGWESSDFAYRNMLLIFIAAMLSTFSALTVIRRRSYRSLIDVPTTLAISVICVPAFIALIYMVGKYSLFPLHGVVEIAPYGCCTQGMVFPREQVDGLIAYLQKRGHGQTDTMIEEYAEESKLIRYALAPQQLQHVGLKSSRDNTELNAQSTWAFYFEENVPKLLRKEHDGILQDKEIGALLDKHGAGK